MSDLTIVAARPRAPAGGESTTVREDKRRRLKAKGWKIGTAQEFLHLSAEEAAYIDLKARLATSLRERRRSAAGASSTSPRPLQCGI